MSTDHEPRRVSENQHKAWGYDCQGQTFGTFRSRETTEQVIAVHLATWHAPEPVA